MLCESDECGKVIAKPKDFQKTYLGRFFIYFPHMGKERSKVIPAAYLVLTKDNKILLSRRYNTGFEDGKYSLPAGHLDGDEETLAQAMVREVKEEIGVKIDLTDLALVHVMHRKHIDPIDERRVDFFFRARRWEGKPSIKEPSKCDGLRWFDFGNLPNNTIPYVRQAIECFRKGIAYSEYGFSEKQ